MMRYEVERISDNETKQVVHECPMCFLAFHFIEENRDLKPGLYRVIEIEDGIRTPVRPPFFD